MVTSFKRLGALFQDGVKNILVNGLMSVASVLTVLACLIILGIFLIFTMNLNALAIQLKTSYQIRVFIEDGTTTEKLEMIESQIGQIEDIKESLLVTKRDAIIEFQQDLGDDHGILSGLENEDQNPLRDEFRISLKDLGQLDSVISRLERVPGIAEVSNNKEVTDTIINVADVIRLITFWLIAILVVMTVVIISNTVKIAVFARKKEINIMKYIGATDFYIRFPFIVEGIIIGIVGGAVSYAIVYFAYSYFYFASQSTILHL